MKILNTLIIILPIFITSCNKDEYNSHQREFTYDFKNSYEGWIGGFADHSDTVGIGYDLCFERTKLPLPLNTSNYALKVGGTNRSDDLFMFIKKKIIGLEPNKTYKIQFDVEFASNVPNNQFGVGGAPDAVMMKVGATIIEPISSLNLSEGIYRMNIDHGQQRAEGKNMINIGTIGVADETTQYTMISLNNKNKLFETTASSKGELWVIVATDSGFESRTELYYTKISLILNP